MTTGERSRRLIGLLSAAALAAGTTTLALAPAGQAMDELVPDHVATTWNSGGDPPEVLVTKVGATYTGTVLRAFSLPNQHRCEYLPGQVIWTMEANRERHISVFYSGTALVYD